MILINNTTEGYLQNIEIKGNTIQNPDVLSDIKSVGNLREDGLYEIPILCTGKNLFDKNKVVKGSIIPSNGEEVSSDIKLKTPFIRIQGVGKINTSGISSDNYVYYYDSNKNFIKSHAIGFIENTVNNAKYIKVICNTNDNLNSIQIEEGIQVTPYEPYQEHKLNILSSVQLEKVGDIADRIIEKNGVWGVEKNVVDYILNGINCTIYKSSINNYVNITRFWISNTENPQMNIKPEQTVISDSFKSYGNSLDVDEEGVANTNGIDIHILKSKLSSEDVVGFNKYLKEHNVKLMYIANQPQFIPLSDDQQVKLRTFANQTNISFLTEVEGTIKADVPKSLGASVKSNTQAIQDLNKDLEKVKKLEEATNVRVSTNKGNITCKNTVRGRVKDVMLTGKTLINRFIFSNNGQDNESTKEIIAKDYKSMLYSGLFSIPNISNKCLNVNIYNRDNDRYIKTIPIQANSTLVIDLDAENAYLYNLVGNVSDGWKNCNELKQYAIFVQGNHKNLHKIIPYFEGIKSVGELENLTISSRTTNLFDEMLLLPRLEDDGYFHFRTKGNTRCSLFFGFYNPKTNQAIGTLGANASADLTGIDLKGCTILIGLNGDHADDKLQFPIKDFKNFNSELFKGCDFEVVDVNHIRAKNVFIQKGYDNPKYTPHKQSKKKVLYYNPTIQGWEKVILREWDSIEEHSDGKYYYHKRSSEIVINGYEDNITLDELTNTTRIIIPFPTDFNYINGVVNFICDKYKCKAIGQMNNDDIVGDFTIYNNNKCYITVPKGTTLEQGKQMLQANPVTVVYQLAQKEIYECTSLDVDVWDGDSILQINSVIPPKEFSFNISNNIGNIVKDVQEDVSNLKTWKDNIENVTSSTIITENAVTNIGDTQDGYFSDVEIEGETLVNIAKISTISKNLNDPTGTFVGDISNTDNDSLRRISKDKEYTFMIFLTKCPSNATVCINKYGTVKNLTFEEKSFNSNEKMFVFKSKANPSVEVNEHSYWISLGVEGDQKNAEFEAKLVILEGNYTQKSIEPFEGMKSIGDDVDEIKIISTSSDLKHVIRESVESAKVQLQISKFYKSCYVYNPLEYEVRLAIVKSDNWVRDIVIPKNTITSFSLNDKEYITNIVGYVSAGHNNVKSLYKVLLIEKYDKKKLLYYDTETQAWKKPISREWDSIEEHSDRKYYYHKNSEEVVLNGEEIEDWSIASNNEEYVSFKINIVGAKPTGGTSPFPVTAKSDKFVWQDRAWDVNNISNGEGFAFSNTDSYLYVKIYKSKLETQNVNGFKKWLQANPATIVYQLAKEKVYECTPIDLITYDNETNYMINCGPITPKTTLKCQNYIGNIINTLKKKVSLLEDDFNNYRITQNRLQLASMYSADSVTFKVDCATTSSSEIDTNEDLYNLLEDNILVGKENYDRAKMENMILDYVSWHQISWDQFDILMEIIDYQHTPSIELLPIKTPQE